MRRNYIGLLAGYCLPISEWMNLTGQIGVAQVIQTRENFPMRFHDFRDNGLLYYDGDMSITDYSIDFPLKISLEFKPFTNANSFVKNISVEYALGFYLSPDFGWFSGAYHGPQINYTF